MDSDTASALEASGDEHNDILIVDDQPENLQLLFDTLSGKNYDLRRVLSGKMALQVAQFDPPDLVLLDIRMPGIDGYEVCRQLKADARTQAIPVVFLSALDEPIDKVKAFEVGGADYISKPFQVAEVIARVQHQLRLSQMQARLITQQKQLAAYAHDLETANQELEFFSSSASHDLRTPLRGLQSLAQALIEDYGEQLDELGNTYLQRIKLTAVEMDTLLKNLLDYSRIGRAQVSPRRISIRTVLDSALRKLRAEIERSDAVVEVQEDLPTINSFPLILEQVATNLISNALKYVSPGTSPRIYVGAEQRQQFVRWFFRDNGIGIEDEYQARIFRPFERLHGYESYPGTGFGLAIVQRGIERLGGRYGVESTPGKGSCFWVEIPI